MSTKQFIISVVTACSILEADVTVAFNGYTRTDWDPVGYPLLMLFMLIQGLYYYLADHLAAKKKLNRRLDENRRQAKQGSAIAQFELGKKYETGTAVAKDETQALSWYEKAAEQGHAEAQNKLGYMFEVGKGTAKDGTKAAYWYHKAAEQGLSTAQYSLGVIYEKGKGIVEDEAQAIFWYRKASEQGNLDAQEDLKRLGQ